MGGVRLITEPVVHLVGRPAVEWGAVRDYLRDIGSDVAVGAFGGESGQALIELGARVCYQSDPRAGRKHSEHIRHLQEVGHFSCDEHAQYTFLVAGVSRSLSHEIVRHRHHSPSQLSQRYCDQTAHNLGLVVPVDYLDDYRDWAAYYAAFEATDGLLAPAGSASVVWFEGWYAEQCDALDKYKADVRRNIEVKKLTRKRAYGAARSRLPECCETRMELSGNLNAWRTMLGKRCQPEAEAEIRRLCCRIFDRLAAEAPDVFADLRRVPLGDGTFALERGGRA